MLKQFSTIPFVISIAIFKFFSLGFCFNWVTLI